MVGVDHDESLSRRITRPLRSLRRQSRRPKARPAQMPAPSPVRYDSWLDPMHGDELGAIDTACRSQEEARYALFAHLDADLWGLLLTQQYDGYPNIRRFLPDVPDPALQVMWTGTSGAALAAQSIAFTRKMIARYAESGPRPLADSRVLDFGCGWGRLTRVLARDVAPGNLYGCDPVQSILDRCRADGVPGQFERSEFLPEQLPFDGPFDLVFAFSVFTHVSERAHEACLRAIHAAMQPGGLLVLTVRPPAYLAESPELAEVRASLETEAGPVLGGAQYVFAPHPTDSHPQYDGEEMTYGETIITLEYVRQRWARLFELEGVDLVLDDLHQVMLTLRRR